MFDIGFTEMVVVAIVALIVIGPERLPKAARTAGHLFGRLQRYVSDVKADISREMELDELRKMQAEVQAAARELETSVHTAAQSVESDMRSVESQLNALGDADHAGAAAPALPGATTDTAAPAVDAPGDPAATPSAVKSRQGALPGFEQP